LFLKEAAWRDRLGTERVDYCSTECALSAELSEEERKEKETKEDEVDMKIDFLKKMCIATKCSIICPSISSQKYLNPKFHK